MNYKIIFLVSTILFLNSCQAVKDGLAGNKNENSDEFLIEKKNPLEIPPDFGLLPEPKKKTDVTDRAEKIDENIEKLLKNEKIIDKKKTTDKSAEDFVLKQIKNKKLF